MARLCDICHFINGDRGKNYPSQAEIRNYGDVPFINAGHIIDGKLDFDEMNYISQEKYNQLNSGKIQENDILYCLRGSLGKKAIVKGISIGAIASSLVIIRPNIQKINSEYLFYALESPTVLEQMMQANNGTSQPNLSAKSVGDYTFNLPAINEQIRIVSKLEKVNELISLRKQQLAKLDELVKARFVELFGDPVKNDMGWESKTLNDVCDGIGDGLHGTPVYDEEGEYPFINGNNLIDGEIVITPATKMVSEETYQKHFIDISPNAILISINGTLGKLAFYNGEKVMLGKSACYCNLKQNVNKVFVYSVMKSDSFAEFLDNSSTKSTIKNVGLKAMREYNLILPPTELQEQFATFVEQIEKSKSAIQQSLDKLEMLKKALMQKYFG